MFVNQLLMILVVTSHVGFAAEVDDTDSWIDPYDMINFDHSSQKMLNKPQADAASPPTQEETAEEGEANADLPTNTVPPKTRQQNSDNINNAVPLFKQYVKRLLRHMDGQLPEYSTEEYHMWVKLSPANVATLQKFADGEQGSVHDVHEILVHMLQKVTRSNVGTMGKSALWLEEHIGISFSKLVQVLVLVALATFIIAVEIKTNISWKKRASKLVGLMFLISVPWTWYELYKAAEVRQQSVVMKDMPAECYSDSDDQNWWEFMAANFRSVFTFQEDKCLEYYEHVMIHPVLRVPPTKAIAVTFVRFFVAPAKDVGGAISEFIRALLVDLPLTLYPVAIVLVSLFFFMILFMWFGYSVRLPFFLSIEPSPQHVTASNDGQLHQAIMDSNQQLLGKIEELQRQQQITEENMADKLEYMERFQKAALEYSASSESKALVAPPTLPAVTDIKAGGNPAPQSTWTSKAQVVEPDAENVDNVQNSAKALAAPPTLSAVTDIKAGGDPAPQLTWTQVVQPDAENVDNAQRCANTLSPSGVDTLHAREVNPDCLPSCSIPGS